MKQKIQNFFAKIRNGFYTVGLILMGITAASFESSMRELDELERRIRKRRVIWPLARRQMQMLERCESFLARASEHSAGCAAAHEKLKKELDELKPLYSDVMACGPEGS